MLSLTTTQRAAAVDAIAGQVIATERMNRWAYCMDRRVRFELDLCRAAARAAGLDLANLGDSDLEWLARAASAVVELADQQLHIQHRAMLDGIELRAATGRLV